MRAGFTLIEICLTIAIIGLLVAVTAPQLEPLYRRAQAAEATSLLPAIAHAQLQHHRDTGRLLSCPAVGEIPTGPVAFPDQEPCWQKLGVQLSGPTRYRYAVEVEEDWFVVRAEGDLDGDGLSSSYTLDGRTLHISSTHPLE